jgi:hypothetical protein
MTVHLQRPIRGSKPWYGNFSLGLMIDNHPRFTNIIIALMFVELVIAFKACTSNATPLPSRQ